MKIFIIGKIRGENRSQHLLQVLASKDNVQLVHDVKWSMFRSSRLNLLSYYIGMLFLWDIYKASKCEKVVYLAMNEEKLFLLLLLRILKKEVILDFYTSRLLFACGAAKLNLLDRQCTFLRKMHLYIIDKLRLALPTKLIFLNPSHASFLSSQFSLDDLVSKSCVIPLIVPDYGMKKNFVNKEAFNVCWWGKASKYHGLEYVLKELAIAKTMHDNINLYFFDDDKSRVSTIKRMANSVGLSDEDVCIRGDITFRSGLATWLIENCDLAIGSLGFLPGSNLGIANKTLEAWSLGLPICTQATVDVPATTVSGAYLDEPKNGELSSLLMEAFQRKTLRGVPLKQISENARVLYDQHYSNSAFSKLVLEYVIK